MRPSPFIEPKSTLMNTLRRWPSSLRRLALVATLALATPFAALAVEQETFSTPEAATEALLTALKADSDEAMIKIFGEAHRDLVTYADRATASASRARIVAAMQTLRVLHEAGPDRRVLVIGDKAWPVPIPIVRTGERWRFASEEGEDELLNRLVGANERNAIYVLRAFVDAQRVYASRDRNGDGVFEYAQKLRSTPTRQDGLYWAADPAKGEEPSPVGPLLAESAPYLEGRQAGDPYRGYHFKILTRQGPDAAGGAYNYLVNGRMIAGFAMVAYPADHGHTGVMTFIVNHNGQVFEKDLGPNSAKVGAALTNFNPGAGWKKVAP